MVVLSQQRAKRFLAVRILVPLLFVSAVAVAPAGAGPQSADGSPTQVPVVVSDFELFSVPPPPPSSRQPALAPNQQKPKSPPVSEDPEIPSVQARRLTDFFAVTLVETLRKSGYNVRRQRGQNSPKGALVRGVFAEPDDQNRIRRELWGGSSPNAKFFLYAGIFNMARPDQPLYQLASDQPGEDPYGPVITLNNYIPLAKYELDKNPTEEDIRKICRQIADSLTALLAANPSAFAQ
jgi:Domain of unknown function (DUF4410)